MMASRFSVVLDRGFTVMIRPCFPLDSTSLERPDVILEISILNVDR
jgi:hypothetical protein